MTATVHELKQAPPGKPPRDALAKAPDDRLVAELARRGYDVRALAQAVRTRRRLAARDRR